MTRESISRVAFGETRLTALTEHPGIKIPQFYLTTPSPCPYLPGRLERKVFTQLLGDSARPLNDALTHAGFRRSQNIAYKPACDGCAACVSVRVDATRFQLSKSQKRVLKRNQHVRAETVMARPTDEQFRLLRLYLDARHPDGGMADMDWEDYCAMVEDSAISTHLVEFREASTSPIEANRLIATALTDVLSDGLSMVYSFFDPALSDRSLGTYMVLNHLSTAVSSNLQYVYLGYWVKNSRKMAYKSSFQPLETLGPNGWSRQRAD